MRALLADQPDPGPMPDSVTRRIQSRLGAENRLRLARGPLAGQDPDADVLAPLIRQRQRPRPWLAVAAVAAAAAVVAVGGSALHLNKEPNPAAVVRGTTTLPSGTSPSSPAGLHIQLSTTDYAAATFGRQVRSTLDHPRTPLHDLQSEAPSLGPVATPAGLTSCLEAIGEFPPYTVSADLALYDDAPAVIVAVTRNGRTTGYAMGRQCQPGNVQILRDATPIP